MFIKTIEADYAFYANLTLVSWTCNMRIVPILVFGIFMCEFHGFILEAKKHKGRSRTGLNAFFVCVYRNVNVWIRRYPELLRNQIVLVDFGFMLADRYKTFLNLLWFCSNYVVRVLVHSRSCWMHSQHNSSFGN